MGAGDTKFARFLYHLAEDLLEHRQYAAAERMLRECLEVIVKSRPDDYFTLDTKAMLGATLLGQRKYADAEPLLLKAYEGMKQKNGEIPHRYMTWLAELFEATCKKHDSQQLQGNLTDATHQLVREVSLTSGKLAIIELRSGPSQAYLQSENGDERTLIHYVDRKKKGVFLPEQDGVYRIIVRGGVGECEILIRQFDLATSKP